MVPASSSLKEYLKRYENNDEAEKKKKKKKKKKQKKPDVTGVLVVDEDPVWQKPVILEEENDDSADEERPQIDEDIEVKRMMRLEQLKSRCPFGAISEDSSGWVSVSDAPPKLNSDDHYSDMSPPRKRRSRNDTLSPGPELKPSSTELDAELSPRRQRRNHYHTPSPETLHSSGLDHEHTNSDNQKVDISPPLRWRTRYDPPSPERDPKSLESGREVLDLSSPRWQSHGPDPDLSPPRRSCQQKSSEYERKNSGKPDLPDISVPLRVRRGSSYRDDSNSSPAPELSAPRKSRMDIPGSLGSDLSPPRKSSRDLSPPRKNLKESTSLTDRPKTGLVTGKDVKEEILKTKKQDWLRFKDMDPSISGRGAEPVYRDKITGERLSKDQVQKSQKKEEKPKAQEKGAQPCTQEVYKGRRKTRTEKQALQQTVK